VQSLQYREQKPPGAITPEHSAADYTQAESCVPNFREPSNRENARSVAAEKKQCGDHLDAETDRPSVRPDDPRAEIDSAADRPPTPQSLDVDSIHSRLPVHIGTPEEMLGVVQAKDLLNAYLRDERPDIRAHVQPAANVPDTADALDVVDVIKGSPVHTALVHDEYGHFQGVITTADILEAIVGEFRTDEGPAEPDAVQRDDGSWLIAGRMPVDEMADQLSIALPPERNHHTAAGFALDRFGHLPATGESFDHQDWRSEVVDSMVGALTRFC
jgi:putative hemolysin